MYGFEAINAANGWAMASVGILIVFSGLVVLSFVISKLQTIVDYLDKKEQFTKDQKSRGECRSALALSAEWPTDIMAQANLYKPIVDNLGPSFELQELYLMAEEYGVPHPHLTITQFRNAGILVSQKGDCSFTWHLH